MKGPVVIAEYDPEWPIIYDRSSKGNTDLATGEVITPEEGCPLEL